MPGQNYIGKIAAIVSLNTRGVSAGASKTREEISQLGGAITRIMSDANRKAGRSFNSIFTPVQRLQQALNAVKLPQFNIPKEQVDRATNFARALESAFDPLKRANLELGQLGAGSQAALQTDLNKTIQVVTGLGREIEEFGSVSEARFAAAAERVKQFAAAVTAAATAEARLDNEQKARLAVANAGLNVLQRESDLLSLQGLSTTRDASGRSIEERLNDINRQRQAEEQLANSRVAAAARAEMASRKLSIVLTDEAEATDARTRAANAALASSGGRGATGIGIGIDSRQLTRLTAEVDLLETKLVDLSVTARGPAVASIERYRQAVTRAFRDGTIATDQGRAAIAAARREMVGLTAAASGVSVRGLTRELQRVGDVSTRVGARGELAFQQIIFAIDDAISVTGGLEQRVRAAGNNITQIGAIMGGAAGTATALAAIIGTQVVAAYIKYQNGGAGAEEHAKALNDVLERQKTLAEDVASAFDRIAKRIGNGLFSPATDGAREFESELKKITEGFARTRDERALSRDPAFVTAKAKRVATEEALLAESDPAIRGILVRRQRELQDAEDAIAKFVLDKAPPAFGDIINAVGVEQVRAAARFQEASPFRDRDVLARATQLDRIAKSIAPGSGRQALLSNIEALQRAEGFLAPLVERGQGVAGLGGAGLFYNQVIKPQFDRTQQTRGALESQLESKFLAPQLENIVIGLDSAGEDLRKSVLALSSSVEAGVPGAKEFLAFSESLSSRISSLLDRTQKASLLAPGRDRVAEQDAIAKEFQGLLVSLGKAQGDASRFTNQQKVLENERLEAREKQQKREEEIRRGLDLMRTEADSVVSSLRAIDAAVGQEIGFGIEQAAEARAKILRDAAPVVFGLADSVQNALLQGPSRAALNAVDVSTSQGAAELNRLLRGDDAARNPDSIELRRQSELLERIALAAERDANAPILNP